MPCRDALKAIFKVIMSGSEAETQKAIDQFKGYFNTLPPLSDCISLEEYLK